MEGTQTKKPMNKTEILTALAEASGLTKQQVADLFQHLAGLIAKNLAADGPASFATCSTCCKSRSSASRPSPSTWASTPSPSSRCCQGQAGEKCGQGGRAEGPKAMV